MLKNIFSELNLDYECNISKMVYERSSRSLSLSLEPNPSLDASFLGNLREMLENQYGLSSINLNFDDSMNKSKSDVLKKQTSGKNTYSASLKEDFVLLGNDIKIRQCSDIQSVSSDSGTVCVCGSIFSLGSREIYGGKSLITFEINDQSSSVLCKYIAESSKIEALKSKLCTGMYVKVRGEAQYDKFSRDTVIFVYDINKTAGPAKRKDVASVKRIELHAHTQMSSMDSVIPAKALLERAYSWGHKAIAITDHGVVQAFPEAADFASKCKDFKVIYGVECYICENKTDEESFKKLRAYHAVILARNYTGLKNLYKIITESHVNSFYKRPRVEKRILDMYREGLILGSACERGELYEAVLKNKENVRDIASYYDYFEIMPLSNNKFMVNNGTVESEQSLIDINKKILALGDELNRPVVATCDVHFLDPEDYKFRAILQAGQGYEDAENQAPLYLRTTDEMISEFSYLGEGRAYEVVVENTNKICDMIQPLKPIPDGTFPPEMDGAEEKIRDMCTKKAEMLYGNPLPDIVKNRMEKELEKITKYGFAVLYYIAHKLVAKSLEDGYLVGSRGSVGSSFVAFLADITEVNALKAHYRCRRCSYSDFDTPESIGCGADLEDKVCPKCNIPLEKDGHDIPFETFLGFEGDKEPDIDLNFSGVYQPVAHKYTEELFGAENVFRAGTIATLASKTAYGFVKKYLDSNETEVSSSEINRLVNGCLGVKRTTGQHPGGLMILPKGHDIHEFTPVQYPADDKNKNILTTHFDYHSISGRLLKLDLLGHDDPTVIKMLEDLTGVNARLIPLDDQKTMSIFTSSEALNIVSHQEDFPVGTLGIPEFGTKFVRQMLLDTKPTTFSELVRISGLSHGTNVWLNNAQELVNKKIATLKDVICTRDDIMVYLMYRGLPSKTAFDIMERVRKGKKLTQDDEQVMRLHNVPEWYISSCNKIEYMFPKAHAVAYVTMAFRIAYFKVNYPIEFYITYYSVRADEFDACRMLDEKKVVSEIKRLEENESKLNQKDKNVLTILQVVRETFARGIKFLPVDIYKSEVREFKREGNAIRVPLIAIAGLGESAAESIVNERNKEKFHSVEDLQMRSKVNKTVIEILRSEGCLGNIPESSQIAFF